MRRPASRRRRAAQGATCASGAIWYRGEPMTEATQSRRSRRVIALVLAGLLLAGAAWAYWRRGGDEEDTAYVTATVERGPVTAIVTATGEVNPVTTVQVGTYVSGPIL